MGALHLRQPVSVEEFLAGVHDKEVYGRREYRDGAIVCKDPDTETLLLSPLGPHAHVQTAPLTELTLYARAHPVASVYTRPAAAVEEVPANGSFRGDERLPGLEIPLAAVLPPERRK